MSIKRRFNNTSVKFIVSLLASLLVIILTQDIFFSIKPIEELELKLLDTRFQKRGEIFIKDTAKVIIVEISQDSYDQILPPNNSWPWPHNLYAKVIHNLTQAGVKAIGIDLTMADPDRLSPRNDSLLVEAIRESHNVILTGKLDVVREAIVSKKDAYELKHEVKPPLALIKYINERYGNYFFDADSTIGIAQMPLDNDGIARRYYPYVYSGVTEKKIPSFGFAILNKYYGLDKFYTAENFPSHFVYNGKDIPKYDNTSILINFYGYNRSFQHFKFIDILDDKDYATKDELDYGVSINTWDDPNYGYLQSGIFKDKIVLIGSTMPEDKDLFPISMGKGKREGDNLMYGVEVHANAIQNVLSSDFISKQSQFAEILWILFLTIFSFFVSSNLKQVKIKFTSLIEFVNLIIVAFLIFTIDLLSIYAFINHNYIIPITSPTIAVIVGYFGSTAYHLIIERKQNAVIRGMFGQYVSKALVSQLINNPDKMGVGGERKKLTILFSDLTNFTTFSENKEPEELVKFMNNFLSIMTDLILLNKGTLDKYLGDAIMAFWGAPIDLNDHAFLACKTAIMMEKKLDTLSKNWAAAGETPVSFRIGIHTGDVIVGNIGGEKRFDYTVMGDSVNLASRLEGANKNYKTSIMISESTYKEVKDKVLVRELDVIRVKGRQKTTRVFELIGLKNDAQAEEKIKQLIYYCEGLKAYKKRNFGEAINHFSKSLETLPHDFASNLYLNRSQVYLSEPPGEDWEGVFIMKSK